MSQTVKFVLTPLLLAQAMRTRKRLPKLPEPPGEREGAAGEGPPLRLLITGDSSAAGVGVTTQRQALAGQLVPLLAQACGARVEWRLLARTGLNTAQTLHYLQREHQDAAQAPGLGRYDIAIVVTGVNDVIDQVPSRHAIATREALAGWLRSALDVAHVVFAALPPVHQFPSLPQPLRWISGADARRHDRALARWAATRSDVSRVPFDLQLSPGVMASDGFHPGEPVYRQCATAIAQHVASLVWPPLQASRNQETDHGSPPPRQDLDDHRREPGHRPGDRPTRGGRRREHRSPGQDHRTQP